MNEAVIKEEETMEIHMTEDTEAQGLLERIGGWLLMTLAFLLPVFFVPSILFPIPGSKVLLFSLFVIAAFSLLAVARLRGGKFAVPRSPILLALGGFSAFALLSSLFSGAFSLSFVGRGFEVGTAGTILIFTLLVFLIAVLFKSREQVFGCYLAFLAAFFLLVIFHLLRFIFGPAFLSFGVFTDVISNTLGKWNDLGVFFGASALLSLLTLESLSLNKFFRFLIGSALLFSLFFLAVINFEMVWVALGFFSLTLLIYRSFFKLGEANISTSEIVLEGENPRRLPRRVSFLSLFTLLVSVVFIFGGASIGNRLATFLGVSTLEARPSWSTTFDVAKHTLASEPLFGVGPNRFVLEWLKWKPAAVNETIFWSADFDYGVGLIPTFFVTVGILGVLAWLAFFALFLYAGLRAMFSVRADIFSRYLVSSSFLVALFLWVFSILYIPSQTVLALTFLFTGLFIAALSFSDGTAWKTILFSRDPRGGFVSVLLLILLLIGSVTFAYFLVQRYAAAVFFEKGASLWSQSGDPNQAEAAIIRAAELAPTDVYSRALAELSLARMNILLNQAQGQTSADALRAEFQNLLGGALLHARQALTLDPVNYQNFLQLGRVYEAVVPLRIEGAYENAKSNYEQALALYPVSPAISLMTARLEIAKGDHIKAREYIAQALAKKRNYLEAVFLLSQLEVADGDIKAAIQSAEAAAFIAPSDPTVLFQLGLLRFNDKNYEGAVEVLERAIVLTPSYANAKYYLGLSYEQLGRKADALAQFADIQKTNPDNELLDRIIKNLKAGRSSSTSVSAERTEKLTLPVSESEITNDE